jgi:hypothetical protein
MLHSSNSIWPTIWWPAFLLFPDKLANMRVLLSNLTRRKSRGPQSRWSALPIFGCEWFGRNYASKQVEANVVTEEDGWLVITVPAKFF